MWRCISELHSEWLCVLELVLIAFWLERCALHMQPVQFPVVHRHDNTTDLKVSTSGYAVPSISNLGVAFILLFAVIAFAFNSEALLQSAHKPVMAPLTRQTLPDAGSFTSEHPVETLAHARTRCL